MIGDYIYIYIYNVSRASIPSGSTSSVKPLVIQRNNPSVDDICFPPGGQALKWGNCRLKHMRKCKVLFLN